MEVEKDQVSDDVSQEEDQSSDEQSKESQEEQKEEGEEKTPDPLTLIPGLQKGYTQTRQDLSALRKDFGDQIGSVTEKLEEIANNLNRQSGAERGEDNFVTVGSLKQILAEERTAMEKAQNKQKKETDAIIDQAISDLKDEGVIKTKADENELMNYAIEHNMPNLYKAAISWSKNRDSEKLKETAKKIAHKKESSSTISSSKKTVQEQGFIDYGKLKSMAANGEFD